MSKVIAAPAAPVVEVVGADIAAAFAAMKDPQDRVGFATLLGIRSEINRLAVAAERIATALENGRG
jgi:hypothetical protein